MLDFWNWTFSSPNLRMRAIMPPNCKFCLNWTIWSQVISKKWSAVLYLGISELLLRSIALLNICVCVPDFVKFGRFAAEIWSCNNFQNGGRPPCWIFEIWHFHQTFVCVRLSLRTPKFVLIGHYGAELYAKKWFPIWHLSAILNLGISEIFLHFRRQGQNMHPHTKFRHIRTIRG